MNKKIVEIFICMLLICNVLSTSGHVIINTTNNPTILSKGETFYVGGTGPNNYTHIQDAIDDADDGDTVFVFHKSIPYYRNIIIDKSINLIGEDRDTTIIDGTLKHSIIILVKSDNVKIESFTIRNSYYFYAGLKLKNSRFVSITNNLIINNFWGIELENSHFNRIIGNIIQENKYVGIMTNNSAHSNIIMHNNIINSTAGVGIGIGISIANQILNNNISFNRRGIVLYDCKNNNIKGNIISENSEYGIYLRQGRQNRVIKNNFINNNIDVYFEIEYIWENNNYFRNYWNEPLTKPKRIYGKIGNPFSPEHLWINIDWFPAKEPYDIIF